MWNLKMAEEVVSNEESEPNDWWNPKLETREDGEKFTKKEIEFLKRKEKRRDNL